MHILVIGSDQNTDRLHSVLDFAQQEGRRRGGNTWLVLVAGEGPDEELQKTRCTAAALANRRQERKAARGPGKLIASVRLLLYYYYSASRLCYKAGRKNRRPVRDLMTVG